MSAGFSMILSPSRSEIIESVHFNEEDGVIVRLRTNDRDEYVCQNLNYNHATDLAQAESPGRAFARLKSRYKFVSRPRTWVKPTIPEAPPTVSETADPSGMATPQFSTPGVQ